jgi:Leucine-rich repeat (LRR) protein
MDRVKKEDQMKGRFIWNTIFVFFFCVSTNQFGAIPAQERTTLIALYNATNGDNWTDNSKWKLPPLDADGFAMPGTEGSWYGISVSGDSVVQIRLNNNQLSGSIPPELGNLSNLWDLHLEDNQFTGNIPSSIGDLTQLKHLGLKSNQLSGHIPAQIGNLIELTWLNLFDNQLTGNIPPELGKLENLQDIYLGLNQLTGSIPTEIGNLKSIKEFEAKSNSLTGSIPSSLGQLSDLKNLLLDDNQLSGRLPIEITDLNELTVLSLPSNLLSGTIPAEIGNLSNLQSLYLSYNQLSGEIPSSLTKLTHIEFFSLAYNCLSATDLALRTWLIEKEPDWELNQNECGGTSPTINLNRKKMYFTATASGMITKQQHSWIYNTGSSTLNWTVSADTSWLNCTGLNGIDDGIIYVSVDPNGLATGAYTGMVSAMAPNATNSPQTILVHLNVIGNGQTKKPFGDFATPLDGTTVSSSIPVTGWALDDVGIESVKIYREAGNKSLVYIGDAVFVERARPDVEEIYSNYPNNYKAGWGYMMLTNFLPEGNGEFTIHAIATDMEGESVTLGTKTIIVDNAHVQKPFGALDTPGQGELVSGSHFINWGWALTPQPNSIPSDGSTINVWINGNIMGHPVYNNFRNDIATLFPGYANSDGAVGYFTIDTNKLINGRHTISWHVKDSANNQDGIGSRYISVLNTGKHRKSKHENMKQMKFKLIGQDLSGMENSHNEPVSIGKGFIKNAERQFILPDEKGRLIITARELERLEVRFFNNRPGTKTGRLIYTIEPLPVGANLDSDTGVFSWQLGVGFVGQYEFVFIEQSQTGQYLKKVMIVNIKPKLSKN